MEEVSNKLPRGKCCSADGIPREYCKDGTVIFRVQYRPAFNALILGQQPTTHAHEWLAGIVALVLKILGALAFTDNRPLFDSVPKSFSS